MRNPEFPLPGATWTRRSLLKTAALGACAWTLPSPKAAARAANIPIALQLYSVRTDCRADFDAALARIAQMGFQGVEFAGYYNYESRPVDLRKRLDDLDLRAAGTHIPTARIREDALPATIEFHQAIGCKYLIVPSDKDFFHPENSRALAETFNKAAAVLTPLGMACGYHNHTNEFRKDGDRTYWDLFAERTVKEVVLQQDCGWSAAAGLDPAALIRKHAGRSRTVHFKATVVQNEAGKKAILGQDSVDWAAVIRACVEAGGTEWIVLEQEQYPDGLSPMECTQLSLSGLKRLLG